MTTTRMNFQQYPSAAIFERVLADIRGSIEFDGKMMFDI
jgi:hypothetical protein